jgi:hypothetical protein
MRSDTAPFWSLIAPSSPVVTAVQSRFRVGQA